MKALFLCLPGVVLTVGCHQNPAPVVMQGPAPKAGAPAGEAAVQPKIKQTGQVDVLVADFERAHAELRSLLALHQGTVVKAEFTGSAGMPRGATWVLRVPVESFESLIDGIVHLGKPTRRGTEAEDVTEEFIDVQARLNNLKQAEKKLNDLMQKAESHTDVIAYSKEIRQLRGEIESIEARFNYLSRVTALATIHLSLHEEQGYKPLHGANAPTFGTAVKGTWDESLDALGRFGTGLALFVVAIIPWLPVLAPVVGLALWRRRRRRRASAGINAPGPTTTAPGGEAPVP